MKTNHPTFILHKPEYLSNSLQQLFHNREKAIKEYTESRKKVALVEMEISYAASPWRLGQIVNYLTFESTSIKAIVAKIEFQPEEPFYKIFIRPMYTQNTFGKLKRITNLALIIGACNAKPIPDADLLTLIDKGVLKVENFIDPNDRNFSSNVLNSYAKGEALMKVSPQIELWLKESLRLGKKPANI